jgi:hypothetical protein
MGKLLRVIVFALGGLLLLIVAAAVILPMVVDPNDFKDEISQAVESKTGRVLAIEGDIGLSVFPWLGLAIGPRGGVGPLQSLVFSSDFTAKAAFLALRIPILHQKTKN